MDIGHNIIDDFTVTNDFTKAADPSEIFRELVVTAAVRLYTAKTVEECSAFGPPTTVNSLTTLNLTTNVKSSTILDSMSPMTIPESTEGSPPPPPMTMVLDLARLVLGQSFRCHPADGHGTRTAGCRLPTTGGRKSSTTTTPDRGSTGSPSHRAAAGKTLGLRAAAGKRKGKTLTRRRRRSKRTPKKTSTIFQLSSPTPGSAGSRLLPIFYRLGFNSEDGTLTAHPFRPGSPQMGAESTGGSGTRVGLLELAESGGRATVRTGLKTSPQSSMIPGTGAIKLRPVSRSFAEALFHSWTVLYYPASLLLITDAGGGGSSIGVDEIDEPTNPHYLRWLESYRFLVDQLGGNDPQG